MGQIISMILKRWERDGRKSMPDNKSIPLHPEFVYRKSKRWKGWADFLGNAENDEDTVRDLLEDKAFKLWEQKNYN